MRATRFAAQAVTLDGYGDTEIVVQALDGDDKRGYWAAGPVLATLPITDGHTSTDDLDAALADAGYTRRTPWAVNSFGVTADVVKEG
jgi:hypothetical protein